MKTYHVIGVMSGSSLDGIDLAYCKFEGEQMNWKYELLIKAYIPYPTKWKLRLANLTLQNAITYIKTHTFFGHYMGTVINEFIRQNSIEDNLDFIASHGQTIFHQPDNLLTSQIGDASAIAYETGFPVIANFRNNDVAAGGQGAPIAPIGDLILFPQYSHLLNLGGISNISFKVNDHKVIGYDICAVNMLLNALAGELDMPFDKDGKTAESGKIHQNLLDELNSSWYFDKRYPKSLSGGWVAKVIMPIFGRYDCSIADKLKTACEHIAEQIAREIKVIYEQEKLSIDPAHKICLTGGGAFNKYLASRIAALSPIPVELPDKDIIQFKEAILMALMGVLRVENINNIIASVTGARFDTIGGCIYQGHKHLL